ncbi:reverse transcriptase domain-containing protein [Tanacetum coccineum]|uniref:Reverse transcriptase domain-containing protein n=1 Tax=Tanacetum coccineum TaxID=301880 RepID=A0ABQ5CPB1_9ASTR
MRERISDNGEGLVTANVNNRNGGNGNGGNDGCSYKTFTTCNPKEFDGKGGAVALTRWIEKMESVFENSGCTANQRVRYAASCFINKALTWWNTQVQARGREAAIGMSWNDFKALLVEEFCLNNEMEKLENEFWNHTMVGANNVAYTDRFHELAKLVPHLVTPESSRIKRYIHGLVPQIRGMLRVTQLTTIQSAILTAGILTDEVVRCGTLTKGNDKRKEMEESNKQGSTWKDNKKSKTVIGGAMAPKNTVKYGGMNQRACYECGSLDHLCYDFPKWKQATGLARNPLALKGNRNTQNNKNQARGKAFNGNAVETFKDPKVMTEPCIVNHGYAIEIADGKSVEVNRAIRDCKLELGNSLFSIDLIPLGHGSFDVIVGMDWLSKNKAVIVCQKEVGIPIKEGATTPATRLSSRIDLVSERSRVAKSPYRLCAPAELARIVWATSRVARQDLSQISSATSAEMNIPEVPHFERDMDIWSLTEVHFLGHVVNQSGIHVVTPPKIWNACQQPKSISNVKSPWSTCDQKFPGGVLSSPIDLSTTLASSLAIAIDGS